MTRPMPFVRATQLNPTTNMLNRSRAAVAVLAATVSVAFLAGCNTTSATATPEEKKAAKEEYVVVEPEVGSRIKKRIKKSELNRHVGTSPTRHSTVTAETETHHIPTPTGVIERGGVPGT